MGRARIPTAHALRGGYISHTMCLCIYRMYTLQGVGGGKVLAASTNRSGTPEALGAPVDVSQQTLTRASTIFVTP